MNTTNRSIPFPTRKATSLGSGAVTGRPRASGRGRGAAGLLLRGPGSALTVCAHTWARGPRVPGRGAAARPQPWTHSSQGHRGAWEPSWEKPHPQMAPWGGRAGGGTRELGQGWRGPGRWRHQRTRAGLARAGQVEAPENSGRAGEGRAGGGTQRTRAGLVRVGQGPAHGNRPGLQSRRAASALPSPAGPADFGPVARQVPGRRGLEQWAGGPPPQTPCSFSLPWVSQHSSKLLH